MSKVGPIIELHPWLGLPSGQALLAWEQARIDALVSDMFGFHALQLGLPELDGLRTNRMPHRWLALDAAYQRWSPASNASPTEEGPSLSSAPLGLRCDFESLPFASNSLDLVVLPHALELARDPHDTLREVERVLVPEGKAVIIGFNPMSLWGTRQRMGRGRGASSKVLPQGEFIGYWRLRDWLRLLDLEVETGSFGCWRPMAGTEAWWQRLAWMERAGERWWPVLGAVYVVVAVKRVRGMHLVGKIRKTRLPASAQPAVVTQRHPARAPYQQDVNG
jgi:SAM-dependent methyltransferase